MRKLVLRLMLLLSFTAIIYLLFVIYCPIYYNSPTNNRWFFLNDLLENPKVYATKSNIFIGDSRLNAGINFNDIPDAFNLSVGGASTIELYFILKKYLAIYPKPKRIVFSQSPRFFSEVFSFWNFAVRNHFFDTNELSEIFNNANVLGDTCLGDNLQYRAFLYSIYFPEFYQPDIRANRIVFAKHKNTDMVKDMIALNGKRPHPMKRTSCSELNYETRYTNFKPAPLIVYYFDKFLAACDSLDIDLLYLSMPMNQSSVNSLNPIFVNGYEEFIEVYEKRYPRFTFETKLYAYPDSFFGDPSHLNSKGARVYTANLYQHYFSAY